MKNIHVLPTDKPSRLYFWEDKLRIGDLTTAPINSGISNQHIYITNDEEIKDGEKCITFGSDKCEGQLDTFQSKVSYSRKPRKIILTTDQDLIGVQTINDGSLKWFVKNPSCEEGEVINSLVRINSFDWKTEYKIIIPKEEPKQETIEEAAESYAKMMWGVYYDDVHPDIAITQTQGEITKTDFIAGAKCQQERSYSEEDMKEAFDAGESFGSLPFNSMTTSNRLNKKEWFEQFKKK